MGGRAGGVPGGLVGAALAAAMGLAAGDTTDASGSDAATTPTAGGDGDGKSGSGEEGGSGSDGEHGPYVSELDYLGDQFKKVMQQSKLSSALQATEVKEAGGQARSNA